LSLPRVLYHRVVRLRKDAKIDLISKVPLFAGCSRKELSEIANLADLIERPDGHKLIREGDRGSEFFVVVEGTLRVSRRGRKIRDLGAGDWVGEIALISKAPRSATVVTASPVRALVVTDSAFKNLLQDMPSIATKVLATLGERIAPESI
jgi:CRP/FNR family transcriptional regulator, cyclic AMP receptor protein